MCVSSVAAHTWDYSAMEVQTEGSLGLSGEPA